jgi:hypothetical protein
MFMPVAFALAESTGPNGTNSQAVRALGERGAGVDVGLISLYNALATHETFENLSGQSQVINYDFTGFGVHPDNHDTALAGIIVAGSAGYTTDVGVSPDATLHSARIGDDENVVELEWLENALNELIINQNCKVIVSGISIPSAIANGSSIWTKVYDYYAYQHNVLFANPAGNSNTVIDAFGDAYNGVTTGGLRFTDQDVYKQAGTGTGSGMTTDGREKPDITCPSEGQTLPNASGTWSTVGTTFGQTSYATPHTAGVAALLMGLANSTPEPYDNKSEVLKATIVNTAMQNVLDKNGNPTTGQIYNTDRGYGRINALRAYELLDAGKIVPSATTTKTKGWAYGTIPGGYGSDSYFITATKGQRLVLTVTWHRKVTKSGSTYSIESSPMFDLDVTVKNPSGAIILNEPDSRNNLDKIEVVFTADGVYEVVLKNTTSKVDRSYGLAFELIDPIESDVNMDYIVDEIDLMQISSQWLMKGPGLKGDVLADGSVDQRDFAILANNWLVSHPAYH